MSCDIQKCHSECCRHIALQVANSGADFERYAKLHGIEVKPAENGVSWVRLPLICQQLDQETGLCKVYDTRPQLCRDYPGNGASPFIDSSVCPPAQVEMRKSVESEQILEKYGFNKSKKIIVMLPALEKA